MFARMQIVPRYAVRMIMAEVLDAVMVVIDILTRPVRRFAYAESVGSDRMNALLTTRKIAKPCLLIASKVGGTSGLILCLAKSCWTRL